MRGAVAAFALLCALLAPSAVAAANPSQDVARARGEFYKGNYQEVISALEPQLVPEPRITDEEELKEAQYLLAEAYFFTNQRDKARTEFIALLYTDPQYRLDPVIEDSEIYGFFEGIRSDTKEQIEEIQRKKREAELAKNAPKSQIVIEREIHDRSWLLNFAPFGVNQFSNGQRTRGWVYLSGQAVFGGISLAMFAAQAIQYGLPSRVPPEDESTVRTMQIVQIGTGALFFLFYGASVIDAFSNPQPKIVERRREVPIEKPKTSLVPFLTPDAAGLGVSWEF